MDSATLRFLPKVDFSGTCWEWKASKTNGYGMFQSDGKWGVAHRWIYRRCGFPIPPGFDIDHLCRNRACVNPFHLEAVPHRENVLRGQGSAATKAKQTHCVNGHEFTEDNTYRSGPMGRHRNCRACAIASAKRNRR